MPIYAILKRFLGELVDVFVVCAIVYLYYVGVLQWIVFVSSLEVLLFFYFYKIYYILFVRQYDNEKFYVFTWDFYKIFSKKFLKSNNWYIYILFILMPWNLFWYILISFIVFKKLIKVWINGNKDIFFKKYFGIDIRVNFEKYIIWYYTYIDRFVRIFIHEPLLRMIVVPTLIRNAVIYSSFFSLLKARMFMFIFVSLLIFSGLNEYFYQPWYIWLLLIYIYFLIIWPLIIKLFNIEYANFDGMMIKYTTPESAYSAFVIVMLNSVSLNCLNLFMKYLDYVTGIDKYLYSCRYMIFPVWYKAFLLAELFNKQGFYDPVKPDRMSSAIMFWRYEKTYSSFINFNSLAKSNFYYALLGLYMINNEFYGRHISKEEIMKIKDYLEKYIKIFIFSYGDSMGFLNFDYDYSMHFFCDKDKNVITKGKYDYTVIEFFNNVLYMSFDYIPIKFQGLNVYIDILNISSFFERFHYLFWPHVEKLWDWFYDFLEYANENEYITFSDKKMAIIYLDIIKKMEDKVLSKVDELDYLNDILRQYEDMHESGIWNQIVKSEELKVLIKSNK